MAKIVIADDTVESLYTTSRFLKLEGHEVYEAGSGYEALILVQKHIPDLVILDVKMPDISGFEVAKRIKENPLTNDVSIIHLSATYYDAQARIKSYESGSALFLNRPIDKQSLTSAVDTVLTIKKYRKELEVEYLKWELIAQNIPFGICIFNANFIIDRSNDFFIEIIKSNKKNLTGKNLNEILDNDLKFAVQDLFNTYLKSNREAKKELKIKDKWYELRLSSNSEIGKEKLYILTFADITVLFNQREILRKALDSAEESDRLKSAFLSNLSHELRTPANGILGFIDIIKNSKLKEEERDEYLNFIEENTRRLIRIVTDIVQISKVETDQTKLDITKFHINELLDEIYKEFEDEIKNKNLKLIRQNCNPDLRIETDKEKLKDIFYKLIENAVKYTFSGYVKFGCKEVSNTKIFFFVEDTGIGIEENEQKLIFKRFYRINNEHNFSFGSGLGLAIAKHYTKLLGGNIKVDSEAGKGSTFYFDIPNSAIDDDKMKEKEKAEKTQKVEAGKTPKILIVEDEELNYVYLRELLKKLNIVPEWSALGEKAIELCKQNDYDIVFMDLKLPDISGYMATKEILKVKPDMKIIAQSAYTFSEEKQKAIEAGCVDFIVKPFKLKTIKEVIEKYSS